MRLEKLVPASHSPARVAQIIGWRETLFMSQTIRDTNATLRKWVILPMFGHWIKSILPMMDGAESLQYLRVSFIEAP